MNKEQALKRIEELKAYVEKCEEKEKAIPEMPQHGNYNVHIVVLDELHYPYSSWERSFFTDNLEAQRVCDYMNRYVKDIKRQMF